MDQKVVIGRIVAAFSSLIFTKDRPVISRGDYENKRLWNLMHKYFIVSTLYGTIICALFEGLPTEKFVLEKILLNISIHLLVLAIGSAIIFFLVA